MGGQNHSDPVADKDKQYLLGSNALKVESAKYTLVKTYFLRPHAETKVIEFTAEMGELASSGYDPEMGKDEKGLVILATKSIAADTMGELLKEAGVDL